MAAWNAPRNVAPWGRMAGLIMLVVASHEKTSLLPVRPRGATIAARASALALLLGHAACTPEGPAAAADDGAAETAVAQPLTVAPAVLAPDGAPHDRFGFSIAISGDTLIVGSPDHDHETSSPHAPGEGIKNQGAAYVFVWDGITWRFQQELLAPLADRAENNQFGHSVAISGDTAVVGAPATNHPGKPGAAYVFVRYGNVWHPELPPLTLHEPDDRFGWSAAMTEDTLVIGALSTELNSLGQPEVRAGSAHVFQGGGPLWAHSDELRPFWGEPEDHFGHFVAVSGKTIVVGAPADDDESTHQTNRGSAWVFEYDEFSTLLQHPATPWQGWRTVKHLSPPDAQPDDRFGTSVAVSGDTVIVGARRDDPGDPDDDEDGSHKGSAYVFDRGSGAFDDFEGKLVAAEGAANSNFGWSSALSGDTAVIGAYYDGDDESGAVHVFTRAGTAWVERTPKLVAPDVTGAHFGASVALSGCKIAVGATWAGQQGTRAGAAYVFTPATEEDEWPCNKVKEPSSGGDGPSEPTGTAVPSPSVKKTRSFYSCAAAPADTGSPPLPLVLASALALAALPRRRARRSRAGAEQP